MNPDKVKFTADQMERATAFFEALTRLHASNPMVQPMDAPPAARSPRARQFATVKGKRSLSLKHRASRRKAAR